MLKQIIEFIEIILVVIILSLGCKGDVSRKNSDGTVTKIKYTSNIPFQRAPHFEKYSDHVDMEFNGRTWYSAYLAERSDAEEYDDFPLLAQSSNTKVYYVKDESDADILRDYVYVMSLKGTDVGCIIFVASESPWNNGNDFDTNITYLVNWKTTQMDKDFEILIDEDTFYDNFE